MSRAKPSSRRLAPVPRRMSQPLASARRKLLDAEPGGSSARPLEVATAAVIEPKATSVACPHCNGAFELVAHDAHLESRLREVKVACRHCGERRTFWFRISAPS
jgi:hypothetical protein